MLNKIYVTKYTSPCGNLVLGAVNGSLCLCDWDLPARRSLVDRRLQQDFNAEIVNEPCEVTSLAACELDEYFSGKRQTFDCPLIFAGSDFRHIVWHELLSVPFGETASYADIARRIGRPEAVRAVASAIGDNPLSIFIPCHRIIGASGSLTGYAGRLEAQKFLLDLERQLR